MNHTEDIRSYDIPPSSPPPLPAPFVCMFNYVPVLHCMSVWRVCAHLHSFCDQLLTLHTDSIKAISRPKQ